MRRKAAKSSAVILVTACLAAAFTGCSAPDVADRAPELVGPLIKHHGGRLVSVKIHPKWGMAMMSDGAGAQIERIGFGQDTTPGALPAHPIDGVRLPSIGSADFDVDGYVARVSETSGSCGMDDWEVKATALSSSAVVITQVCAGQQTALSLNGTPVNSVDDVWSPESFATAWNELLTVNPSGQVLDLNLSAEELTAELPPDASGSSCQMAYKRALAGVPRFELPVISSQCQDSAQGNKIDLTAHDAKTVWEQVASLSREHGIVLDKETSLRIHREGEGVARLTLSRSAQAATVDLTAPR